MFFDTNFLHYFLFAKLVNSAHIFHIIRRTVNLINKYLVVRCVPLIPFVASKIEFSCISRYQTIVPCIKCILASILRGLLLFHNKYIISSCFVAALGSHCLYCMFFEPHYFFVFSLGSVELKAAI